MSFLFLGLVFLTIIVLLTLRRPLYQAILGGLAVTAVLFRFPPSLIFRMTADVCTHWSSLQVLVSLYCITFLQRMLEARSLIKQAGTDLDRLFHNRRVNVIGFCLFIGLLPSAAAMILCGDIVKGATEGYLQPEEQAFVTSWVRHIPESTLPTYSSVILMTALSGVSLGSFIPFMLVPVLVLGVFGYFPYLTRVPADPGTEKSDDRKRDLLNLLSHLWPLLLILVLILAFRLPIVPAIAASVAATAVVYRFRPEELLPMFRSAFEKKLLLNTFLVLVLKEFIAATGVLEELPGALEALAVPPYLVFALLFFIGGVISGSSGIIAMGTPLAIAVMGNSVPLVVLLMCMCHASAQISPTHVCLVVASEYYHIPLGKLIRKTIPRAVMFAALMVVYYLLLVKLGIR